MSEFRDALDVMVKSGKLGTKWDWIRRKTSNGDYYELRSDFKLTISPCVALFLPEGKAPETLSSEEDEAPKPDFGVKSDWIKSGHNGEYVLLRAVANMAGWHISQEEYDALPGHPEGEFSEPVHIGAKDDGPTLPSEEDMVSEAKGTTKGDWEKGPVGVGVTWYVRILDGKLVAITDYDYERLPSEDDVVSDPKSIEARLTSLEVEAGFKDKETPRKRCGSCEYFQELKDSPLSSGICRKHGSGRSCNSYACFAFKRKEMS